MRYKGINQMYRTVFWLVLPIFILYTCFVIFPALSSIYYSLTSWDGLSANMKYIGFENFKMLFHDPRFYNDLKNTLVLAVLYTIFVNIFAMLLAILVDKLKFLKNFFRSIFYIPVLISGIVVGFIWSILYNYNFGVFNIVLTASKLPWLKFDWLGKPEFALYAIIITLIWQKTGYFMIIYLAGLQGIPQELMESAKIDGANSWHQFRTMIFPMLAGAMTINLTLALVEGLRIFDQIAIMTDGGPGFSSETLTYIIYRTAFSEARQGYGTALAFILFALILVLAFIQIMILKKREVEL